MSNKENIKKIGIFFLMLIGSIIFKTITKSLFFPTIQKEKTIEFTADEYFNNSLVFKKIFSIVKSEDILPSEKIKILDNEVESLIREINSSKIPKKDKIMLLNDNFPLEIINFCKIFCYMQKGLQSLDLNAIYTAKDLGLKNKILPKSLKEELLNLLNDSENIIIKIKNNTLTKKELEFFIKNLENLQKNYTRL